MLPVGKAGVGSAVNDVTRELGGTFGVAVVGAVFSTVYGPRLAQLLHGAGLPAPALAAARQSPAAALQVAGRAPASTHAVIIDAANRAFVAGLSRGSLVCAGVVALAAVFAFLVLPRRLPGTPPSPPAALESKPGQDILSEIEQAMKYVKPTDPPRKVRMTAMGGGTRLQFPSLNIVLEGYVVIDASVVADGAGAFVRELFLGSWNLGVAQRRALLLVPVDPPLHRVDVHERHLP